MGDLDQLEEHTRMLIADIQKSAILYKDGKYKLFQELLRESGIKVVTAGVEKRIALLEKLADDLWNLHFNPQTTSERERATQLETLERRKSDLLKSIKQLEPSSKSKDKIMSKIKKLLREYYHTAPKVEAKERFDLLSELIGHLQTLNEDAKDLVNLEESKKKLESGIDSGFPSRKLPALSKKDQVLARIGDGQAWPSTIIKIDGDAYDVKLSDGRIETQIPVSDIRDWIRKPPAKCPKQVRFDDLLCKYDTKAAAVGVADQVKLLRDLTTELNKLKDLTNELKQQVDSV